MHRQDIYAYILMSLVCLCIYVTYMLIYAMLDSSHNMQRTLTSILQYLCHLCAYVFMSLICSSMQCLTVHTICKELSPQYYSRFHGPSRDLKVTCQSTPFKRGSVSPSSAHSLRIHAMKEQGPEYFISTTVLRVCKNKRLLCIDKTFMLIYLRHLCAYVFMSLICSSMQCLTVHKVCKEHSSQCCSRFHDPSRE